jgi:putative transposase
MRRGSFAPGEFYHLYNRGTDKRKVFLGTRDHVRFLALLYLSNTAHPIKIDNLQRNERGETLLKHAIVASKRDQTLVDIGAYCLMSNHFHLLVREKEGGGISKFMQKLLTAYTMYFNKRNERTGALFEGVFRSTHVDDDTYLRYLTAYIHLNPIKLIEKDWKETGIRDKKRAEQYLKKYCFSSYIDHIGIERPENAIIEKDSLLQYFDTPKDFKTNITEWLEYRSE